MEAFRKLARLGKVGIVMLTASISMHAGALTKFNPMDPLGTSGRNEASRKRAIHIEIAPGNWGDADLRDIQTVLDATADEFLRFVKPSRKDIEIRVIPRASNPEVRYERGVNGEYVIQLTARDNNWFQYVFQFSHELCHVFSHYDHKARSDDGSVAENNQWFEESLCETASLFMLRRLATAWAEKPPSRNWTGYGAILAAYAQRLMNEPHRRLGEGQSFSQWYGDNRATLNASPYLREKNELVAAQLLPLFEDNPRLWQAINYLNPNLRSAGKPFADYVADWQAASPDKTLSASVQQLFGLAGGGQEIAAAGTAVYSPRAASTP